MKRLIRLLLNTLPRPLLQRLAGIGVPLLGLLYLGWGRKCPICGVRRRKFLPYGYVESREDALCPRCLALERHRLLWLFLDRETELLHSPQQRVLHVAPEVCYISRLRKLLGKNYITADLESPLADMHFDVQSIPLEDDFADVILCNHIMEHIEDDLRAMRELHRVLRPGGWGIILSPVEQDRNVTFEDDSITDPEERTRIFGQYDHRRIYGRDYADRLRMAGFEVSEINYIDTLSEAEKNLYALRAEVIYRVTKLS